MNNFDWIYYLSKYSDLRANGVSNKQQAIQHWKMYGEREGRVSIRTPEFFDWQYYLDKYPDLRANGLKTEQQAIQHWYNHGEKEGRVSIRTPELFDWQYYLDKYPDLRANGLKTEQQAIQHWYNHGKKEKRLGNNKIHIYCDKSTQHFFIDYINSILTNYSERVVLVNELTHINSNNIVIFIQSIPNTIDLSYFNYNKVFLLNTEQLSRNVVITNIINTEISIIDYSLTNISYLKDYNKYVHYLPYIVNKNEIVDYEKTHDVAIVSGLSPHRSYIKNALYEKNLNINEVTGFYKDRDELLFKHKILLNIHFDETYKVFEQMRCNRCIFNKMIVITEKSIDVDYELKPYIIECEYDKLVETTINVLNNYEYFYNKLFESFNIEHISNKYKLISDDFFNKI
jgi:hypothetical protein